MPRARVALLLLPCVAAYVAPRGAHYAPVRVAPRAAALAMSSAHIQVLSRSTHDDGTLDVHRLAATAEYEPAPAVAQRAGGVAYFALLARLVAARALPAFARLVLLQYVAFSAFEYTFHRWCMHAKRGTPADVVFARWNRLHVQHHCDTNDDMSMLPEYNWKGIRFNFLTSQLATLIGSLISLGVVAACRLDLPAWPTPLAAATVSLYHGVLWNRLHTDSHGLQETLSWDDGLPYVRAVPCANRYARWLLTNHIGHHAVGGKGNYNIVFPGPDHLFGTFYRLKRNQPVSP